MRRKFNPDLFALFDLSKKAVGVILAQPKARRAESEELGFWGGAAPPAMGPGGVLKAPPVRGEPPAAQRFWTFFIAQETLIDVWYIISILPKPTSPPRPMFSVISEGSSSTSGVNLVEPPNPR